MRLGIPCLSGAVAALMRFANWLFTMEAPPGRTLSSNVFWSSSSVSMEPKESIITTLNSREATISVAMVNARSAVSGGHTTNSPIWSEYAALSSGVNRKESSWRDAASARSIERISCGDSAMRAPQSRAKSLSYGISSETTPIRQRSPKRICWFLMT